MRSVCVDVQQRLYVLCSKPNSGFLGLTLTSITEGAHHDYMPGAAASSFGPRPVDPRACEELAVHAFCCVCCAHTANNTHYTPCYAAYPFFAFVRSRVGLRVGSSLAFRLRRCGVVVVSVLCTGYVQCRVYTVHRARSAVVVIQRRRERASMRGVCS